MDTITLLDELMTDQAEEISLKEYREREQQGDGELTAARFRGRVVHDHSTGEWYLWSGNNYDPDRVGEVFNMLPNRIASEYAAAGQEALKAGNQDEARAFFNRVRRLLTKHYQEAVLSIAARQEGIRLAGDEWDRNPMVLGVNNGVIDLATGSHRTGQAGEYIRYHSPVDWLGLNQPAPRWEQFILEIFDGEAELANFMQRLLGYCLTGKTTEHRLPILWGEGRNGKSTLLQALAFVFGGELSHTTQADALMDFKRDGSSAQPFVYALRGRRLVWATESKENQRINAGLIKQLTGGDSITTRTLHSKPVTFNPTHKVFLLTNHKPGMSAEDQALWDRVLLIPFVNRFVDEPKRAGEYKRDPRLLETLQDEASGILAWLVRGCLQWQAEGLNPPAQVIAATEEYRTEEDTIADFIEECLHVGESAKGTVTQLYKRYKTWAQEAGQDHPLGRKTFSRRLARRFGEPKKEGAGITFHGVEVQE